jgi:hypothetical protein
MHRFAAGALGEKPESVGDALQRDGGGEVGQSRRVLG